MCAGVSTGLADMQKDADRQQKSDDSDAENEEDKSFVTADTENDKFEIASIQ